MHEGGEVLLREDRGQVRWLTINRPGVHNALNGSVLAALSHELDAIEAGAGVRAVVVTGAGTKAFSAGADLDELMGLSAAAAHEYLQSGGRVLARLDRLPVPVIAAVNGLALGGGFELALAATLIVASSTARFGLPETGLGLMPGYGGTQRLSQQVGTQAARTIVLTGTPIDAADAYRTGLVFRPPSSPECLAADVQELAERIASRGPRATARARLALRAGDGEISEAGLALETSLASICVDSEEALEGVAAFRERRPAVFEWLTP